MKTLEYTTIDKSLWPQGEWNNEPDKRQWTDGVTGFPCLIVRGPSGALCGYVGVSSSHPTFEKDYGDVYIGDVHGGLTFSEKCSPGEENKGICHLVEDGEGDNIWWLGFDCAHGGDLCPNYLGFRSPILQDWEVYRNLHYVTGEVEKLALELRKAKP